jgi:hypothetical protein
MSTDSNCTDDDCSFAARMRSVRPNFYACRDDAEEADVDDAAGSDECEDKANDGSFDSRVGGNIENEERLSATAEVPLHALTIVPRGHRLHLPRTGRLITHLLADDLWQWEPNHNAIRGAGCIQLMTDYTLAAHKAVRQLWGGDVDYLFAMCAFHTWSQWKKKHIGLFRDAASNNLLHFKRTRAFNIVSTSNVLFFTCNPVIPREHPVKVTFIRDNAYTMRFWICECYDCRHPLASTCIGDVCDDISDIYWYWSFFAAHRCAEYEETMVVRGGGRKQSRELLVGRKQPLYQGY